MTSHNLSIKLNRLCSKDLIVLKVNFIAFCQFLRFSVESLELDLANLDISLYIV
jgi:hypothetical protein